MRNPGTLSSSAPRDAIPAAVTVTETNAAPRADTPAEARGRRTLSTAFVRLGAGESLTVELRDGRTMVLRDVVMRRRDYCGVQVIDGAAGPRFCGGYGEVAAARPGS